MRDYYVTFKQLTILCRLSGNLNWVVFKGYYVTFKQLTILCILSGNLNWVVLKSCLS